MAVAASAAATMIRAARLNIILPFVGCRLSDAERAGLVYPAEPAARVARGTKAD
jgi:hypothetical protein